MIPVGWEHGSDGPNSPDFKIAVFHGSLVPGAAPPGHQFMEQEGCIPHLRIERIPTDRYRTANAPHAAAASATPAASGTGMPSSPSCPARSLPATRCWAPAPAAGCLRSPWSGPAPT